MAKAKAKKTKTTQEKPDETSSPGEKASYLIKLLTNIGSSFEALEIYCKVKGKDRKELRRMMSQPEKDFDDWDSADYEEYWKKIGIENQKAINDVNAIFLCKMMETFISEAYLMLQSDEALQDFIVVNSQKDDSFCRDLPEKGTFKDNLLQKIQSIVHDSIEATEFGNLVEQLELVCRKGETKPAEPPKENQISWEVPWDETDKNYMKSGDARTEYTDNKMTATDLSKKLGKIPVHYMRKPGKGARVHIGEFRAWAKKEYPDAATIFEDEAAQEYLDEVEARKAAERSRKRK